MLICTKDTEKQEQQRNDFEDQRRAWKEEKDRLLEMQKEHEDQKKAWEEESERLLERQRDIEAKLHLSKKALNLF